MMRCVVALAVACSIAACRIPDVTFHTGAGGDDAGGDDGPGGTCAQLGYPSVPWLRLTSDVDNPASLTAVGDVDGDGTLDLAVLVGSTVVIYLGDGDGLYHQAGGSVVLVPPGVKAMLLAPLNNDNMADLVLADTANNQILVRLAAGKGVFGDAIPTPTGSMPVALAAASFTADTNLDLVVANAMDNTLSVLSGNGDGTFTSKAVGIGASPSSLALGHVVSDTSYDLVVGVGPTPGIVVLTYDTSAGFAAIGTPIPTGGVVQTIAIGDVQGDGDGFDDIVLATHDPKGTANPVDGIEVLSRQTATTLKSGTSTPTLGQLVGVGIGNTIDGKVSDLIAISVDANTGIAMAQVFVDAAGALTQTSSIGPYELGHQMIPTPGTVVTSFQFADLDHDGNQDFVLLNGGDFTLAVELGAGDRAFHAPLRFATTGAARTAAVGSLSPGHADLAVTTSSGVDLYLQDASNQLTAAMPISLPGVVPYTVSIGKLTSSDVGMMVGNQTSDDPVTELRPKGGSYMPTTVAAPVSSVIALALADLDGDAGQLADLVAGTLDGDLYLQLNDTTGTFSLTGLTPIKLGATQIESLKVIDLDGDGKPDVVAVDQGGNLYSVLQSHATPGTFASMGPQAIAGTLYWVDAADLDGDGHPEAVVIDRNDARMFVLHNTGTSLEPGGLMGAPYMVATASQPGGVALADVTGDGKVDAVVANSLGCTVSVFPGRGDGTFDPPLEYWVGAAPQSVTIADVDGDSKLDIIVPTQGPDPSGISAGVTVLYGRHLTSPSCTPPASARAVAR